MATSSSKLSIVTGLSSNSDKQCLQDYLEASLMLQFNGC